MHMCVAASCGVLGYAAEGGRALPHIPDKEMMRESTRRYRKKPAVSLHSPATRVQWQTLPERSGHSASRCAMISVGRRRRRNDDRHAPDEPLRPVVSTDWRWQRKSNLAVEARAGYQIRARQMIGVLHFTLSGEDVGIGWCCVRLSGQANACIWIEWTLEWNWST
jgi:hypothetical protein